MFLRFADGRPFATGVAGYNSNSGLEPASRIILQVEVAELGEDEGVTVTAIVDTGAPYMVCDTELAKQIGLQPDADDTDTIRIRGVLVDGGLHRVRLSFLADEGDDLTIEATVFVPQRTEGPAFLGMTNCLESIHWAVDPFNESFYFGAYSE